MGGNKNKRQCSSEMLIRQKQFNTRYFKEEHSPKYQPLLDPHTTYYFSNKSVRKHLKHLKRSLNIPKITSQQFHLSHLLRHKIRQKSQCPKVNFSGVKLSKIQKQSLQKLYNQNANPLTSYFNQLKQKRKIHINNPQIVTQTLALSKQEKHEQKCQKRRKSGYHSYANHLFQQLHQYKRNKWKGFIGKKICELKQGKHSSILVK